MFARFACVLLFAIFAEPSSAQGYLGFSAGQTSSDGGFKFFAGHQFTANFALEFAYGGLGRVTRGTNSASLEAADWTAIASWPISNRFSMHGRLGAYYGAMAVASGAVALTDDTVPVGPGPFTPPPPPQPVWQSGTTTNVTFGLGANYEMTSNAFFRLDWQRYKDFARSGPQLDVDLLSLGALFRF